MKPFRAGTARAAWRVLLLTLAFAAPASAQQPAPAAGAAGAAAGMAPGDFVRVEIWQEKDLSGDFLVNPNGAVVLPLLGEQRVTGMEITVLRDSLTSRYRKYLKNPSINITPLRRVQVLGEVNRPGVYTMDPTVTLSGLLALASGPSPNGDPRKISIVRGGQVFRAQVGPRMTLIEADVRSGDQVIVGPKNWFVRNSTFVVSVALTIPSLITGILALVK